MTVEAVPKLQFWNSLSLIKLYENKSFADDFARYAERAQEQIHNKSKEHIKRIASCLENKTNDTNDLLMRLIYMERNLFYHSGEAA